jgi:hypothetical protein
MQFDERCGELWVLDVTETADGPFGVPAVRRRS